MNANELAEIEALKVRLNPYKAITDTKIEPTVVSYTHPAELTDEEIMSVRTHPMTNIEFARAILRKAQENDKLNPSSINIGGVIYQSGKEVK